MGRPAKVAKSEVSEVVEEKESKCMIKTIDVSAGGVSERLQQNGYKVIAISGGIIGDAKVHYFKLNMEQALLLKGKNKKPIITENDIPIIEEVDFITPSKVIDTGLKEMLIGTEKPEL